MDPRIPQGRFCHLACNSCDQSIPSAAVAQINVGCLPEGLCSAHSRSRSKQSVPTRLEPRLRQALACLGRAFERLSLTMSTVLAHLNLRLAKDHTRLQSLKSEHKLYEICLGRTVCTPGDLKFQIVHVYTHKFAPERSCRLD